MYFESDTVKSDCPTQIFMTNDEIFKDLIQILALLNVGPT